MRGFFAWTSFRQLFSMHVQMYVKKLPKQHSYKKCAHLTLMKLTPRVDFTIMCNFYTFRSQKHKTTNDLTVIFVLLESTHAKAAHKMLVKLTPGVDFINVFCAHFSQRFSYERLFSSYILIRSQKTCAKMLVTLTLSVNFINVFARFFRTKFWRQSQNVTRKAAKT